MGSWAPASVQKEEEIGVTKLGKRQSVFMSREKALLIQCPHTPQVHESIAGIAAELSSVLPFTTQWVYIGMLVCTPA